MTNYLSRVSSIIKFSILVSHIFLAFGFNGYTQENKKEVFEKKEDELIANNQLIEAGKLEILSRFTLASPLWTADGLESVHEVWAAEAKDPDEQMRLKQLEEFSDAWWKEVDMRY